MGWRSPRAPAAVVLLLAVCAAGGAADPAPGIDWASLRNPVHAHDGWSVKDACVATRDGAFHLFYSAFFLDRGRERSHVVHVQTADWRTFSDPLSVWDGRDDGWIGMASPAIVRAGGRWYLAYNSWGDHLDKPNQLFYAVSDDLERWERDRPLAHDLTAGERAIDAALLRHDGRWFLIYKEHQTPRMAWADGVDGPWRPLGRPSGGWFENAQLLVIDGVVHLLATGRGHRPYLARLEGDPADPASWLRWSDFRRLDVPEEGFNTHDRSNAAFLLDRRAADGWWYLLYAGSTEGWSHAGRGDNRLGLARSRDLRQWAVPP